jgi:hypothetical protein
VSTSLQTALRSLITSPSACIEHVRKLLDQTWKTSTKNSLETRQDEVGTQYTRDRNTRPIQRPSGEKFCGKKGLQLGCKCKSHSRYLSLSTCCSAWQYYPLVKFLFRTTYTSIWVVIKLLTDC